MQRMYLCNADKYLFRKKQSKKYYVLHPHFYKMKKIITGFFFIFLSFVAMSQVNTFEEAKKQLNQKGEIYFSFQADRHSLKELTKIISIDKFDNNTVYAYANAKGFGKLTEKGIKSIQLLPHPGEVGNVAMSSDVKSAKAWDTYPTYNAYVEMMEKFASDYPEICQLEEFGTSVENRKLLSIRISDNVGQKEDEPVVFLTSTMHGDETTGYILMLRLIDYFLTNYGQDERLTNIVNNTVLVINPLANPDGTYASGNNTVNGATRYNANYVDLNRNFKDPQWGDNPDGEQYQPETLAFAEYAKNNNFTLAFNIHGGAEVLNYPWDTWNKKSADNDWWRKILQQYLDVVYDNSSGYMTYLGGMTNGADWYVITGSRQDYMNYYQNCKEFTLEISDDKLPYASQLPSYWNYNYRSFIDFVEQAHKGFKGVVRNEQDSTIGVKAKIFIPEYDKDNSHIYSMEEVGNYHRMVRSGTYNVEFSAPGYVTKTINNVQVDENDSLRLDVKLWKGVPEIDFETKDTVMLRSMQVEFKDLSKGYPTAWEWTFEGGEPQTSNLQNPTVVYKNEGTFNVKLKVTNEVGTAELVKEDYMVVTISNSIENSETEYFQAFTQSNSLVIDTQFDIKSITIADISGKVIYKNSLQAGRSTINTENFAPGIYIINAYANNKQITRKIAIN